MTKTRKIKQRIPDTMRRAIILACEAGLKHIDIAKMYNVVPRTVEYVIADFRAFNIDNEGKSIKKADKTTYRGSLSVYSDIKKELQGKFTDRCREILDSISIKDYEKAGLSQKAVASGIFMEKSLLLAGEPTQITSQYDKLNTKELLKEFRKQVVGDSKDTEIILEQDGGFSKVKHVEVNGKVSDE